VLASVLGAALAVAPAAVGARTSELAGVCGEDPAGPGFQRPDDLHVVLTRLAGPAESVRTARDEWLPGEQRRVRRIGQAGSSLLRGRAAGLPGQAAMAWTRTPCFVQGPGAAAALGRALEADVVIWGEAWCTAGDPADLSCAGRDPPGAILGALLVQMELPQAVPDEVGWRPAPLPHPVNWGYPLRQLEDGERLLHLLQGLERLVAGAPEGAAFQLEEAGPQAAPLRVEALLLAGKTAAAADLADVEVERGRRVDAETLARALAIRARVHWVRDRRPEARQDLVAAQELALAEQHAAVWSYATLQLALLDEQVGDFSSAEAAYEALVDVAWLSDDVELRAEVWTGLGRVRLAQGERFEAHEALSRALPLWEELREPWATAHVQQAVAETGGRFDKPQRSRLLTEARATWSGLGEGERALSASIALVVLAADSPAPQRETPDAWRARLEQSQQVGRLALARLDPVDRAAEVARIQHALAAIAVHLGQVDEALTWLDTSRAGPAERAALEAGLAEVLRSKGDVAGARLQLQNALAHYGEAGLVREQSVVCGRLSALHRQVNADAEQAMAWARRSLELHREALAAGQPPADGAAWTQVGDLSMFVLDAGGGLEAYREAEALDRAGPPPYDPNLPCKIGRALYDLTRYDEALLAYVRGVEVAEARGAPGLARSCQVGADRARRALKSP